MTKHIKLLPVLAMSLLAFACTDNGASDKSASSTAESIAPTATVSAPATSNPTTTNSTTTVATKAVKNKPVDPTLFLEGALVGEVETVDCTLSGGTKTSCYRMTIAGAPADPETSPEGPYCPPTITSGADEGGVWIDGKGTVYNVDGKFIENLATLYKDTEWQMYDVKTGKVTIINGARGCEVAGDPRPIPGFNNFCLECPLEEIGGGVKKTVLIPKVPVPAANIAKIQGRENTGIALNGVLLGPPAPLEMILASHSLGVFDDCGAHANPHEGYHYHAANGCSEVVSQEGGHSPMIGYALDGYALFAKTDKSTVEATGLDECGGETDDVRGYHYHASAPGMNQILSCYKGEKGSFEGDSQDAGGPPPGSEGGPGRPPEKLTD
ncbi:YHYH protein [Leucothrix arctica]|uniref:YHYH domain-containing protein n=1 Tax=Leucothrix arctica TaxID=1481894 RepID=A0A317CDA0_9GAMM|nr:YHYH protein [Leucothrix arctica]PWQ96508.1 hypothetical protein DKT75_08970 [Leucothrix arctica]